MKKLLKLYLTVLLKNALKNLGISIAITIVAGILFGINTTNLPFFLAAFYGFLTLTNIKQSTCFFGDNLTWLLIAPVSKKKLISYNFIAQAICYMNLVFTPFILAIVSMGLLVEGENITPIQKVQHASKLLGQNVGTIDIQSPTYLASTPLALTVLISLMALMFCLVFPRSKVEMKVKKLTTKQYMLQCGVIFFLYLFYLTYEMSVLMMTSGTLALLMFSTLWKLKKDLILTRIPNKVVIGTPIALALIYFLGMKSHSDLRLHSNKVAQSEKIDEIKFQMKFSHYLDDKKVIEFLHSGINNNDYKTLREVYAEWKDVERFLNENKEMVFPKIIASQKDSLMLENVFKLFDGKNLDSSDIEKYLVQHSKLNKKEVRLSSSVIRNMKQSKITREELLNYLVSSNPVKHYLAVSFAVDNKLNLVPEILKHASAFNDETLEQTKHALSQGHCRDISSMEILNAHKNQSTELVSNCKESPRIPASHQ
ncbi:MAG: hypothetical protein ACOYL6_11090 [Bacteriovoracaceae bacterium]